MIKSLVRCLCLVLSWMTNDQKGSHDAIFPIDSRCIDISGLSYCSVMVTKFTSRYELYRMYEFLLNVLPRYT